MKIYTLSKAPPPVWPHHQHTHKTSKDFTCRFVLRPLPFQSMGQNTNYFNLAVLAFKAHHHSNQPELHEPSFRKLNSTPAKTSCAFLHSPPDQEAMPILPVIAPRMKPSYTVPLAQIGQDPYIQKVTFFYSTFARQLCDYTYFLGWLSRFPAHSNIQAHSTLINIQSYSSKLYKHPSIK